MRTFLAALCLLCATACDGQGPVGPTVPLNEAFTLAPAETATIQGTDIHLQFVEVTGDSRCPGDAICIQAGDANVHVRVVDRDSRNYELHTGDSQRSFVMHGDLRIELTQLQPYPFTSKPIQPSDYRATIVVRR